MSKVQNILVGTDFSDESTKALIAAARWAKALGAKVHVVHVDTSDNVINQVPYFSMRGPDQSESIREIVEEGMHSSLAEQVEKGQSEAKVQIESHLLRGSVDEEILKFIKNQKIDLMILGAKGHSKLGEILLGSVAQKMLRLATIPVVAVRGDSLKAPKSIFFSTDFGVASDEAKDSVKNLAASLKAPVHVYTVIEPLWGMTLELGVTDKLYYDLETTEKSSKELLTRDEIEIKTQRAMDALLEEFKAEGIEAQGELEFAETPKTSEHIIEKAKKANADLIAVGSHGRKGLSKMLLGSVAEKVARNAPCSVLITRHMS